MLISTVWPLLTSHLLHLWRDYFVQAMLRSVLQSMFGSLHKLHCSCNCVIYQEIRVQSNLNEWFQHSPAFSNKVSGIFSFPWYYQIMDSTEITYSSSLFLQFSSGPSSLVLKMQNELHVISLGVLSMWEVSFVPWQELCCLISRNMLELDQEWECPCCSLLCFSQLAMWADLILLC